MKVLASAFALGLIGCATTGDSLDGDEQDSSSTSYVQIQEFGVNGAEDAWYSIGRTINANFDDVCGDTFCEGDFSNIQALRMYCSVTSKRGDVHDCAWAFTASQHEVDTKTAAVQNNAVTYQCHFKPKTTGTKLIALLQSTDDPLHVTLPGMGSIYDTLSDCFDHPIGGTVIDVSPFTTTYVDADNFYVAPKSQAKWADAKIALHQGFDRVCGDTFCGSDYSDVQALDLGCSVTKSTGNVKNCTWNFGGSYGGNDIHGNVVVNSKTWTCPVAVNGTISQMIAAITASTDPETAIHAALPGGVSAYDSIAGCVTR